MSHKEKENIINFISAIFISIPYLIYLISRFQNEQLSTEEELKSWAAGVLLIIPIRIIAYIVMYIILTIISSIITGKQDTSTLEDERDEIIDLKGSRNEAFTFAIGVMVAMFSLATTGLVSNFFIIVFLGGIISEFIGVVTKFINYQGGFKTIAKKLENFDKKYSK